MKTTGPSNLHSVTRLRRKLLQQLLGRTAATGILRGNLQSASGDTNGWGETRARKMKKTGGNGCKRKGARKSNRRSSRHCNISEWEGVLSSKVIPKFGYSSPALAFLWNSTFQFLYSWMNLLVLNPETVCLDHLVMPMAQLFIPDAHVTCAHHYPWLSKVVFHVGLVLILVYFLLVFYSLAMVNKVPAKARTRRRLSDKKQCGVNLFCLCWWSVATE